MDGRTYYRRAMLLPFLLLGVSSAVLAVSDRWKGLLPHALADTSGWVTPLLLMAIVPYGIVILAMTRFARAQSAAHYRMIAFATPVVAGILLGLVIAVSGAIVKGPDARQLVAVLVGGWCGMLVGLPMVLLVELGYWLGRAAGWIVLPTEEEVQVG